MFDDPERSGKSATSDPRTRKQTPLLVHARTTSHWPHLATFMGRDLTAEELTQTRHLLTTCGSRSFVENLVDENFALAHSCGRSRN